MTLTYNILFFPLTRLDHANPSTHNQLGLNTAPQARNFLPTTGPKAVTDPKQEVASYDFNRGGANGLKAEQFSQWASNTAHLPQFFKRPPNYGKIFATVCVLLASLIAVKVAWPAVRLVLGSRYIWAIVTLVSFVLNVLHLKFSLSKEKVTEISPFFLILQSFSRSSY